MNAEEAEEYTQALGQVVSGSWRYIALAKKLGVPKALGLTVREWVEVKLGGYVKTNAAERKEAALELKANGLNNVEVGGILGCDESTVRADLSGNPDPGRKNESKNVSTQVVLDSSRKAQGFGEV